jgi:4,5-dihydroxyphthalate decarboxylase
MRGARCIDNAASRARGRGDRPLHCGSLVERVPDLPDALVLHWGRYVLAARKVHADDTSVKVLAPGQDTTRTGRLRVGVREDVESLLTVQRHAHGLLPVRRNPVDKNLVLSMIAFMNVNLDRTPGHSKTPVGKEDGMQLRLTFACGEYDRTMPFRTKDVRPKGIDLVYTPQAPELTFMQQLADKPFDVSEMSMSAYVQMRTTGKKDFIALPVFPSRIFRHSALYVRTDSELRHPEQLKGKRVGIGYYQMSGAVWVRGILQNEYGVLPSDLTWVSGMPEKATPNADQVDQLADMVQGTRQDKPNLELMLERGEIDALMSVHTPRAMARNEGTVRYLFDNVRQVEEDYFRKTGNFPMMHTLVMRQRLHEEHPWVAQSLFDAFSAAKRMAMERIYDNNALTVTLPFVNYEMERTREIMGRDYWPFGIEANRKPVSTFVRFLKQQEIVAREPDISELFLDLKDTGTAQVAGSAGA